jgi:hypothetical protein
MNSFSRETPSPRYLELLGYYREMHEKGVREKNIPPEETFDGRSLPRHAMQIRHIINGFGARTILDYGSGKGRQYEPMTVKLEDGKTFPDIPSFWNVASVTCFDPGYERFRNLPQGTFDGVISTDVLEHCPKEDINWIIDEIFGYAKSFVFLNVACYPAIKTLPNGENAHCTVEDPKWWVEIFDARARKTPSVKYFTAFDLPVTNKDGSQGIQTVMHQG